MQSNTSLPACGSQATDAAQSPVLYSCPRPTVRFSKKLLDFYAWLVKLSKDGYCYAGNAHLAKTAKVKWKGEEKIPDETTIQRRIAKFVAAGWIRCEYGFCHDGRPYRRMYPTTFGLDSLKSAVRPAEKCGASTGKSAVRPAEKCGASFPIRNHSGESQTFVGINNKQATTKTPTASAPAEVVVVSVQEQDLIQSLRELGVKGNVPTHIVQTYSKEAIDNQIEALPDRPKKDPAAVLVASIKGDWPLPPATLGKRAERAKLQKKREAAAVRALQQQPITDAQSEKQRLQDALSPEEKAQIEEQEVAALKQMFADIKSKLPPIQPAPQQRNQVTAYALQADSEVERKANQTRRERGQTARHFQETEEQERARRRSGLPAESSSVQSGAWGGTP